MKLYKEFVNKLDKIFGAFDPEARRFEKANNSKIARELGYSDSQFSRLINETATEGEYHRAIQNVDRILTINKLESQIKGSGQSLNNRYKLIRVILISIAFTILLSLYLYQSYEHNNEVSETTRDYTLKWAFESNFINPYTGLRDLPSDCNYQCYKFQGKWALQEEYKLPFLRESSGFHYLAKSVTAYIRCEQAENPEGKLMNGFEYQEHEIWYDLLERPIKTFVNEDSSPLKTYEAMNLKQEKDFIKIGTIHSFYINDFTIDSTHIYRKGQDIGREIEFVADEVLADAVADEDIFKKIKVEMMQIAQDPLRDFSQPSSCDPAARKPADFHAISNGDVLSFDCEMTNAGRFPINYRKTYVLKDQFITDQCLSSNQ